MAVLRAVAVVLGVSLAAMAQVAPTVTTLPATGIGATSATLNARFTVGQAQHLRNPGFEDALGVGNWNPAPHLVNLEGETGPSTALFDRVTTYGRTGHMGRLRYGTTTLGWVGLACAQGLNVTVPEGMPVHLSYWIRIQFETGTGRVTDHGGVVEVEVVSGGLGYRIRYYHRRKGTVLPPDGPRLRHRDAGDPGWQTWVRYTQPLASHLAVAFGLSSFTVTAVRLGILMNVGSGTGAPVLHWLWDDVELSRGGVVVWHEYRRTGEPTWQATPAATYATDGAHTAPVAGLAPGATYRHRAALAYEGGVIYGAEQEFQTLQQVYTVQVSAHPPTGGTVGGGGTYTHGTTVTVTATPNACYRFVNWTEGAVVVSTNTTHTFTATANRTLVANFGLIRYTIGVTANPPAGGTVAGGGTYGCGASVTVTATPNAGYRFVNWTEAGTEVWTAPTYTFTATARDLAANFVLVGDANLDGVLDVRDVRIVHQAALGLAVLSPTQRLAADVDGDGTIAVADAKAVAAWIIGWP